MTFFKIQPVDWLKTNVADMFYLKLTVEKSSGVQVTPDPNVTVTDLNTSKYNKKFKNFTNSGDGGITFKISVMIHKDEKYNRWLGDSTTGEWIVKDPKVTAILKKFISEMTVLSVKTDAIDVPNGKYIITKNSSRKQSYDNYTHWELEFTTYRPLKQSKYENNNKIVKNAISQAQKKAKQQNTNKNTGKSQSTTRSQLKKCKTSNFKYTSKKPSKASNCVKLMQKVLYQKGKLQSKSQIDGWFGSKTKNALKEFQKQYKKKYNLTQNGKVDKNTLNALCKV